MNLIKARALDSKVLKLTFQDQHSKLTFKTNSWNQHIRSLWKSTFLRTNFRDQLFQSFSHLFKFLDRTVRRWATAISASKSSAISMPASVLQQSCDHLQRVTSCFDLMCEATWMCEATLMCEAILWCARCDRWDAWRSMVNSCVFNRSLKVWTQTVYSKSFSKNFSTRNFSKLLLTKAFRQKLIDTIRLLRTRRIPSSTILRTKRSRAVVGTCSRLKIDRFPRSPADPVACSSNFQSTRLCCMN